MSAPPTVDALFKFNRDQVPPPSDDLVRFAHRTIANRSTTYLSDERRAEPRHAVAIQVLAIPLDKDFQKCGEPFTAVTRDLSAGGMAVFHDQHVGAKYLALELVDPAGEKLRLILDVLRAQPLGRFYEIGGRFIKKLGPVSPTGEGSDLPSANRRPSKTPTCGVGS